MPTRPRLIASSLFAAVLSTTALAHSDVAPPPGYVEECAVEFAQKTSERCEMCGDAYYDDSDACTKRYTGTEFSRRCKTRGASTWDEVWCRPVKPGENSSPVPKTPPGAGASCVMVNETAGNRALGAVLILLGLALASRRRR